MAALYDIHANLPALEARDRRLRLSFSVALLTSSVRRSGDAELADLVEGTSAQRGILGSLMVAALPPKSSSSGERRCRRAFHKQTRVDLREQYDRPST